MRTRHLSELLVVVILVIWTAPLDAQDQQQDVFLSRGPNAISRVLR
jgi:hypothetical protein